MKYFNQGYEDLKVDFVECPEDEDLESWAEEYITNMNNK